MKSYCFQNRHWKQTQTWIPHLFPAHPSRGELCLYLAVSGWFACDDCTPFSPLSFRSCDGSTRPFHLSPPPLRAGVLGSLPVRTYRMLNGTFASSSANTHEGSVKRRPAPDPPLTVLLSSGPGDGAVRALGVIPHDSNGINLLRPRNPQVKRNPGTPYYR